jgi:hypothetical protein
LPLEHLWPHWISVIEGTPHELEACYVNTKYILFKC